MNTTRLDDQMNTLIVIAFVCIAMLAAIGVGAGKHFGRGDVLVSAAVAQSLGARPVATQQVARITITARRPVALVALAK